jgi:hypothetical protein
MLCAREPSISLARSSANYAQDSLCPSSSYCINCGNFQRPTYRREPVHFHLQRGCPPISHPPHAATPSLASPRCVDRSPPRARHLRARTSSPSHSDAGLCTSTGSLIASDEKSYDIRPRAFAQLTTILDPERPRWSEVMRRIASSSLSTFFLAHILPEDSRVISITARVGNIPLKTGAPRCRTQTSCSDFS